METWTKAYGPIPGGLILTHTQVREKDGIGSLVTRCQLSAHAFSSDWLEAKAESEAMGTPGKSRILLGGVSTTIVIGFPLRAGLCRQVSINHTRRQETWLRLLSILEIP